MVRNSTKGAPRTASGALRYSDTLWEPPGSDTTSIPHTAPEKIYVPSGRSARNGDFGGLGNALDERKVNCGNVTGCSRCGRSECSFPRSTSSAHAAARAFCRGHVALRPLQQRDLSHGHRHCRCSLCPLWQLRCKLSIIGYSRAISFSVHASSSGGAIAFIIIAMLVPGAVAPPGVANACVGTVGEGEQLLWASRDFWASRVTSVDDRIQVRTVLEALGRLCNDDAPDGVVAAAADAIRRVCATERGVVARRRKALTGGDSRAKFRRWLEERRAVAVSNRVFDEVVVAATDVVAKTADVARLISENARLDFELEDERRCLRSTEADLADTQQALVETRSRLDVAMGQLQEARDGYDVLRKKHAELEAFVETLGIAPGRRGRRRPRAATRALQHAQRAERMGTLSEQVLRVYEDNMRVEDASEYVLAVADGPNTCAIQA